MPAAPDIELTESDDRAARDAVVDGLIAYNDRFAAHGYRHLRLLLRQPGGAMVIGGLIGRTLYGWLFVELLFVPEELRGQGLGSELLRRAEAEARARGCLGVHLDTFDFQARPFYEKQGYRVFGMLEDLPPGGCRYFLSKRLD